MKNATDICGVSMGNERIYAINTEEWPRIYVSWVRGTEGGML